VNDDAKRCACVLTGAALLASWVTPAEKAAAVPASTIMLEMICEDIRPRIAAAPAPESQIEHQNLEQPEPAHVEAAAPALPAAPIPFVPPEDDGWQALRLHYVQPPETNMAALLASGAFGEGAILPPQEPA
jgi:hypothetical protein